MMLAGDDLVPIISPDGIKGTVPRSQLNDAMQKGYGVATRVISPKGERGVIPLADLPKALMSGYLPEKAIMKGPQVDMQEQPISSAQKRLAEFANTVQAGSDAVDKGLSAVSDFAGDVTQGVAQSGANLLYHTGKIGRAGLNRIPGVAQAADAVAPQFPDKDPEFLNPANAPVGQKIGKFGGDAYQFMMPAGKLAETGKLIDAAVEARQAPGVIQTLLKLAGKGAVEGTATGAITAAQGGDPVTGAEFGAAGPALSLGLGKVVAPLKASAVAAYTKLLDPRNKANAFLAAKIAPEMAERGIVTASDDALMNRATTKAQGVGREIGNAVDAIPAERTVKTQPILDELEKYKQQFVGQKQPATAKDFANPANLEVAENGQLVANKPIDFAAYHRVQSLQNVIRDFGPDASYESLRKVRQLWDNQVSQGEGYVGKTLAEGSMLDAKKEGANAIRRVLHEAEPDIAKLDGEYSFWKNVERVMDAKPRTDSIAKQTKSAAMQAAGWGFAGYAAGGPKAAVLTGTAAGLFNAVTRSAAYLSASGSLKNQLADAIYAGNQKQIVSTLVRIASIPMSQGQSAQ